MIELLAGPVGPVLIFFLRICDVSLATVRMLLVVRGSRAAASALGFVEVLIWVFVVGVVIQNLHSPPHLVGYAAGFAAGTAVGMWIEGKLALGLSTVQIVSHPPRRDVAEELRKVGYGVTEFTGRGREGEVGIVYTVVRRRQVPELMRRIERRDPDAFIAVQNDTAVRRGWLHGVRRR